MLDLSIQMIGTGSAFSKTYYNNNALVTVKGFALLVDCGSMAPRALYALKKDFTSIDGVLITHIHADHVGGLEELAFLYKYTYKKKLPLFITEDLKDALWENTLKGGLEDPESRLNHLTDYFDVVIMQANQPYQISDALSVELIKTNHIPGKPSYSLFLNKYLFYSADMQFMPNFLIDEVVSARGCQYILHDCQLRDPAHVHATLTQLLTLPDDIQEKIMLMHYGDDNADMNQYKDKVGKMQFMEQQTVYDF